MDWKPIETAPENEQFLVLIPFIDYEENSITYTLNDGGIK